MGDRGRVVHIESGSGEALVAQAGTRCALLATNARWTSFVPLGDAELDTSALAAAVEASVIQIWFDDDAGVTMRVDAPGAFLGELAVPLGDDASEASAADRSFVLELVRWDVLDMEGAAHLMNELHTPPRARDAWVRRHGLEERLGVPFTASVPVGASLDDVRELAPGAREVTPVKRTKPRPKSAASARKSEPKVPTARGPAPKTTWSPDERAVVDLHVHYWEHVFSMNTWSLYNRYKKHLPADVRGDVDALCNAVALGNVDELRPRVEQILARTWSAEDWGVVIRSPKLDDDGADDEVLAEWRRRTGRA